jgi:mycothiol synthase
VRLTTTTWPADTSGEALLSGLGYTPVRYFQRMVIEPGGGHPEPLPEPAGLTVRAFAPADDARIFDAFVESFAEHWGTEHPQPDVWWWDRRDGESAGYDPELWLVAVDGDELAGFITAKTQQDAAGRSYGYVSDLGVRPRWRDRGLGECLLTRIIAAFHARGFPYIALDVDTENRSGALRLYTKVGMVPRPSFTIWSRTLSTGRRGPSPS